MKTLTQLVQSTTGSENILGTILEHPLHGRAVLIDVDRRNNNCAVWHERQHEGLNGIRNLLHTSDEYIVTHEADFDKLKQAMNFFLS